MREPLRRARKASKQTWSRTVDYSQGFQLRGSRGSEEGCGTRGMPILSRMRSVVAGCLLKPLTLVASTSVGFSAISAASEDSGSCVERVQHSMREREV